MNRRPLSYMIEFVRFSTGFAAILACALVGLHFAIAAGV